MSSASARAQEPSMEEILASIRRIISDDQEPKAEAKAPEPEPARPGRVARGTDAAKASTPANASAPVRDGRGAALPAADPVPAPSSEAELDRLAAELAADLPRPSIASAPATAGPSAAPPSQPEAPPVRPASPGVLPQPAGEEARSAPGPAPGLDLSRLDLPVPDITFSDPPLRPAPTQNPERPRASVETLISQEATASVGDAFNFLSHTILSANARTLEDLVRDLLKPMLKTWLDDNLPTLVERLVRAEIERVARGR